jgi:erythronate-4-phosphate dehydrogenase
VVDEAALKATLADGRVRLPILDVWQNEPGIDPDAVRKTFIATPHIAGYSFDGKVAATGMLYEALSTWLDEAPSVDWRTLMPAPPVPMIDLSRCSGSDEQLLKAAVLGVYDILRDDRALREAVSGQDAIGPRFDLLRKNYPVRREFQNTTVQMNAERRATGAKLERLGFRVRA